MNNNYKYVGRPLTPKIAAELIKELFSGQTIRRQEIVDPVVQTHEERGGLPSRSQKVPNTILAALQNLQRNDLATCIARRRWRICPGSNYLYFGKPLTSKIAQELIIEKYSGQTIRKQEIVNPVVQTHEERGGLPSRSQKVPNTILAALQNLQRNDLATCIAGMDWQINPSPDHPEIEPPDILDEAEIIEPDAPSEIGSGEGAIYLYYFPAYRRLAELQGECVWECKIGRTEHDPARRVGSQATAMPEYPQSALIIRTDAPPDMERTIHAILTLRGRHKEDAPGTEWFITCPSEVEAIHAFIVSEPGTQNST